MKINGNLRRKGIFAAGAGVSLTLVVVVSVVFLPGWLGITDQPSPGPGPGPGIEHRIGARIAEYMDSRSADVVFAWCYNNTVVNVNLSSHLGVFVHGVYNDGSLANGSGMLNLSVIYYPLELMTAEISQVKLSQVADNFETALIVLNETASEMTSIDDIWPPTFIWDIAFSDNTSLSLAYSKKYHVIAAVNGTWTLSKTEITPGVYVPFPEFQYKESLWDVAFLELDETSESLVSLAIQSYIELIVGAFEQGN